MIEYELACGTACMEKGENDMQIGPFWLKLTPWEKILYRRLPREFVIVNFDECSAQRSVAHLHGETFNDLDLEAASFFQLEKRRGYWIWGVYIRRDGQKIGATIQSITTFNRWNRYCDAGFCDLKEYIAVKFFNWKSVKMDGFTPSSPKAS